MKAFPVSFMWNNEHENLNGMDLRDYFASDAMKGDFARGIHEDDFKECAKRAYKMADEMMEARKR